MKKWIILVMIVLNAGITLATQDSIVVYNYTGGEAPPPDRPQLPYSIDNQKFKVHYGNITTLAYAQDVLTLLEESYVKLCTERGWLAPLSDGTRGGDNKIDVYILASSQNLGQTGMGASIAEIYDSTGENAAGFIEIKNNLSAENYDR